MKASQKILALLLAICLLCGVMAGCGSKDSGQPNDVPSGQNAQDEAANNEVADLTPDADGNVTITDMAGRTVTFPANPTVWNSSPTSEAWLCAIVPDQIVGWASEFTEEQLAYYPETVRGLDVLGGNFGQNEANVEAVLAYHPDVIVNTYDCSERALEKTVSSADEMSETYGIPVVVLSRDIADTAKNAGLIGLWFGQAQRGAEVEAYLQNVLDKIDATVNSASSVPTYYYAEGMDGLSTEAATSFHADVYTYCGLTPAVGEEVTMSGFGGMEAVSLEQVMQWDPEYIFVWNSQAYQTIKTDKGWADITAVKEGRVYLNPTLPQNWVDRSPNALRILGCLYTASVCYPDSCTYDLKTEISSFFSFMYGVELTDAQLSAVLPE